MNRHQKNYMQMSIFMKLLAYFFVPTSLLGVLPLLGGKADIQGTPLGFFVQLIFVPMYLASVGSSFILNYAIAKQWMKLAVVVLSAVATVHGIHMVSSSQDVWQYILRMPTYLDGTDKIAISIIILLALGVLLLSYPASKALIKSIKGNGSRGGGTE